MHKEMSQRFLVFIFYVVAYTWVTKIVFGIFVKHSLVRVVINVLHTLLTVLN